jgi:putative ABC transport system permease protein
VNGYVEISLPRLTVALGFIAAAMAVSARLGLELTRSFIYGAIRAAVQLIAIGYFLLFLFGHESAGAVAAVLAVMVTVAAATSVRRIEHGPPARVILPYALAAILAGATVALAPLFLFIVRPAPWYAARLLIPVGGMMLSNAMNVVAQVFERVFALAHGEAALVEQLLALGASPRQALRSQTRAAVRASLIPTINGLTTVGLVALPGMMTGQILSGTAPVQAVRYQLVIMYQLVAVAAVAGGVAAWSARRLLFTAREQLRLPAAHGSTM